MNKHVLKDMHKKIKKLRKRNILETVLKLKKLEKGKAPFKEREELFNTIPGEYKADCCLGCGSRYDQKDCGCPAGSSKQLKTDEEINNILKEQESISITTITKDEFIELLVEADTNELLYWAEEYSHAYDILCDVSKITNDKIKLEKEKRILIKTLKAAKTYIDKSPCDYDIFPDQKKAWDKYKEQIKKIKNEKIIKKWK